MPLPTDKASALRLIAPVKNAVLAYLNVNSISNLHADLRGHAVIQGYTGTCGEFAFLDDDETVHVDLYKSFVFCVENIINHEFITAFMHRYYHGGHEVAKEKLREALDTIKKELTPVG